MKIIELRRPSMLLIVLGVVSSLIGIFMLLNPLGDISDIVFLSMFGSGLFISGLGFSLLYQIRKAKTNA